MTTLSCGEAGNDYLAATGNINYFNGGPGNDQMVAAAGQRNNLYVFQARLRAGLDHRIRRRNGDRVDLRGFGLANLAALGPFISQAGADTVITLNAADILTLKSINQGTLQANDFVFV